MTYLLVFLKSFFPSHISGVLSWVLQALRDQQLADPLHQALAPLLRRCGGSLPRLLVCGLEWLTFTWKDGIFRGERWWWCLVGYIYMYRWVDDNGDDDDDVVTHGNWLNLIAVDWWEGVIGTRLDCFLKKGENYRNFSDLWTTLEVVAAKMQCHMVKFVGWLPLWCSGSTGWFSVFFWCTAFSETLLQGLALLEQRLRRFHSESQEVSRLGWNRRGYQQGQQGQRLGRDDGFTLR